jgi:hypothetical protein
VADGVTHTYFNSVNILTGDQGAGKTLTALLECLLVVRETDNTIILVFIKRKDYDPSYESVKRLFEQMGTRCMDVDYAQTEEVVLTVLAFKKLYSAIK